MYRIELAPRAENFLKKAAHQVQERVKKGLLKLQRNPISSDSKFLFRDQGNKVFRNRVGNYRILYSVNDQDSVVLVHKIDKRPRVYRR